MGRRGPPRQSDERAKMIGSDWPKRHAKQDAKANTGAIGGKPTCPRGLGEVARAEWKRILACLPEGHVGLLDRAVLAGYCSAWADFCRLTETLDREGMILTGPNDRKYRHPAAGLLASEQAAMLRFGQELGFTPASRPRIKVPGPTLKLHSEYQGHATTFNVDLGA